MTLYYLLQKLQKVTSQNLMKPFSSKEGDEFIFINNFNIAEGFYGFDNFKMKRQRIKIYSGNSVNDLINLKKVKIANIYFQGTAKKYLNRFLKYRLKY